MIKELIKSILKRSGYAVIRHTDLVELWEKTQLTSRSLRLRLFRQIKKKGFIPTHIIDVGANKGDWARDAHEVFPDCAFTLIEPQVEMKPHLDRFCSEVKDARWLLAGAGASAGELPITVRSDDLSASSFAISEEEAKSHGFERRVVSLVTLDSICEDSTLPIPEIVKIDAEGFELEVMSGAQKLIDLTELFFLEVPILDFIYPHCKPLLQIINYMNNCDYIIYDITDLNRRPYDEALAMMEIAFARRSGVLREPSKPVW